MNERIRKLDGEKLLFWDIETTRRQAQLDINSEEFGIYQYKFRNKETGELMSDLETIEHYNKNAALYPAYNQIVCISVGFVKGDTLYYKAITGAQKDIITEFYELLNSKGLIPSGFNILRFDAPMTRIKAFEVGVEIFLNDKFTDVETKPWLLSEAFLDLLDIVKGTYYNGLSMAECCFLFGVDTPKSDISGADVSRVYWEEENGIDRIAKYCNQDVRATAELFYSIQGKRGFLKNFVDKTGAKVEKIPLMNAIANTKAITKEQEKEIVTKAKTLSKEEKPLFVELLKAALLENAVNYEKLLVKIAK
jgi:hypothetical protein